MENRKAPVLTTTPKSASAALGTFPRVSRSGSQQAEPWGGNSTSHLPALCDSHRDTGMDTGMGRTSPLPPWGQGSDPCSHGLVKKSLLGRSQSDTQKDQAALPEVQHRPRVEIPQTEQKFTSKTLQQIQTNKQTNQPPALAADVQRFSKARVEKADCLGFGFFD